MARWPMAALLSSAALIARRRRDVRKLLRRGSSGDANSGSRHYHDFNLYHAGFGEFLAAAVAQAARAATGE